MKRLIKKAIIYFRHGRLLLYRLFKTDYWRKRRIKEYLRNTREPKLQLGCGGNPLVGWLNSGLSFGECLSGIYLDAGKPFPLPNDSFDYIFSEHLFGHLTYPQAMNMLKECYRVLKHGGTMRIATPNLRFLIGLYQEPEKLLHKEYIKFTTDNGGLPQTPVFAINRFHTAWGHQIIYDKETLADLLQQVGYKELCWCEVSQSEHPALNNVEGHFRAIPPEYNRLETMIIEATKP